MTPTSASVPPRAPRVLEVEGLSISFGAKGNRLNVVESATLSVGVGEIVGLVGESGSGKTVTAMACTGLIRVLRGHIDGGSIRLAGEDVTNLTEREWLGRRGTVVSTIFQNSMRSLNPAFTVGDQIAEVARLHLGLSRKDARDRAVAMLDRVHISRPAQRAKDYPHQFSGGMCQRIAIALALVCEPKLLIADEPTTALDVTVQRRILDLILEMRDETSVGVLLITHDLGVVAETCDRVAVMYAGQVVERARIDRLFDRPNHPYTSGLLAALSSPGRKRLPLAIPGQVPAPDALPPGCRFAPRCEHAVPECDASAVGLRTIDEQAVARCIRAESLALGGTRGAA